VQENRTRVVVGGEYAEQMIEVVKTLLLSEAIKEKGFFSNQKNVAKPKVKKWIQTIDRLKKRFEISE
jgi:hypothetical protein